MLARSRRRSLAVLGFALTLAACSGTASPPAQGVGGGGASSANPSVAGSTEPSAAAGANGFEGTLSTSGLYSATWSAAPGAEAGPLNSYGNVTLTSDKSTFGNIGVDPDGKVSFGSAAPEFGKNLSFDGTGAKVTLDKSGQFVCAFTIDADLKGHADGAILHLSGGLTVHWHPVGVGDLSCP